jgi:hypothetical protein
VSIKADEAVATLRAEAAAVGEERLKPGDYDNRWPIVEDEPTLRRMGEIHASVRRAFLADPSYPMSRGVIQAFLPVESELGSSGSFPGGLYRRDQARPCGRCMSNLPNHRCSSKPETAAEQQPTLVRTKAGGRYYYVWADRSQRRQ